MFRIPARTLRRGAGIALVAVALGACASQDADRDDVVDAVEEAGASRDVANCIGDGYQQAFDQDELNDLADAGEPEDFPNSIREQAVSIIEECQNSDGQESGVDTTDTTAEGSTDSSDTTTEGESTTSSSAAE